MIFSFISLGSLNVLRRRTIGVKHYYTEDRRCWKLSVLSRCDINWVQFKFLKISRTGCKDNVPFCRSDFLFYIIFFYVLFQTHHIVVHYYCIYNKIQIAIVELSCRAGFYMQFWTSLPIQWVLPKCIYIFIYVTNSTNSHY